MANFGKPKIPTPFKRLSIEIGNHTREWRTVKVRDLRVGDVVPEFGLIHEIAHYADGMYVRHGDDNHTSIFNPSAECFAFTSKEKVSE